MSRIQLPPRDVLANEAARQLGLQRNAAALEALTWWHLGTGPASAEAGPVPEREKLNDIKGLT